MLERLRQKRPGTSVGHLLFYEFVRATVWVLLRVLYRIRRYGAARLPKSGAVLLVCNHQSYLDPPAVGVTVTSRHLEFIARLGLFKASSLFGRIIAALNSLPIKEEGGDTAAIKEVLRRLDKGYAVLIFPEGSRSTTAAMEPFKRGVAVLVKRSRCPVIPVAVEGCFDAWPRTRSAPRLLGQRIAVAFGDPIPHDELMAHGAEAGLERLAREVDRMRLALRRQLRRESHGRTPRPGPGDEPAPLQAHQLRVAG